ncbi:MAG: AmmeMemoRadiSam system protein A [Anaerolineales bacterium]|nr:AmmeMemoRadiSam system protein A [Anaerolineales bacterium]
MQDQLTSDERAQLLELARQALVAAVHGQAMPKLDVQSLSPRLREPGATFVTLTRGGELRGCIGALEPALPLAEDVCEHAVAAALQDFRFPPVQPAELPEIEIEISRLTPAVDLDYDSPQELLSALRPGVDGVILRDGMCRATFLPQVWEKLPEPAMFLSHLCQKMGALPDLWRTRKLHVQVYQVEEFHE